jgi:hypothetical protein
MTVKSPDNLKAFRGMGLNIRGNFKENNALRKEIDDPVLVEEQVALGFLGVIGPFGHSFR